MAQGDRGRHPAGPEMPKPGNTCSGDVEARLPLAQHFARTPLTSPSPGTAWPGGGRGRHGSRWSPHEPSCREAARHPCGIQVQCYTDVCGRGSPAPIPMVIIEVAGVNAPVNTRRIISWLSPSGSLASSLPGSPAELVGGGGDCSGAGDLVWDPRSPPRCSPVVLPKGLPG